MQLPTHPLAPGFKGAGCRSCVLSWQLLMLKLCSNKLNHFAQLWCLARLPEEERCAICQRNPVPNTAKRPASLLKTHLCPKLELVQPLADFIEVAVLLLRLCLYLCRLLPIPYVL